MLGRVPPLTAKAGVEVSQGSIPIPVGKTYVRWLD
jgi:hypothetical protein